jgi:hypothetical protein
LYLGYLWAPTFLFGLNVGDTTGDELFDLPLPTPDQSEDVRLTLFRQAGQHDQPFRLYAWKGAGGSVTSSNDRTITLR